MTMGLIDRYDGLICDLDGVIIAGPVAIAHAAESINRLTVPVVFATNNASRTPAEVGAHLRGHAVRVDDDAVLTSSLAAAKVLADELPAGAHVLAVGGDGVAHALRSVGLRPLRPGEPGQPVAVLQGYGPKVTAGDLGEAAHAIQSGARWVATNADLTLPTDRGPEPGNGSLVSAVRHAVDRDPVVIGKPHPPMYEMAARLLGVAPRRVLAVGDRLETDIEGACATGMDSALVLTGVHGPADAAAAAVERRPRYVIEDLRGLAADYPDVREHDGWWVRGGARARVTDSLVVEGEGIAAVRVALDALWSAVDAGRIAPETAGRWVPGG